MMTDATRILNAIEGGDSQAAAELLPVVYEELRRLAAAQLAGERRGQTLNATALVHEAYLRLVANAAGVEKKELRWESRAHFFAAAAEAMRRILIDAARRKRRLKHGGGRQRVSLDAIESPDRLPEDQLLELDEALKALARAAPLRARLVELRFFAGLSVEDAASCVGISRATADRWWSYARAWLFDFIKKGEISKTE
jgi:RNA polymerase sigma factor (TIGR02999 family)